MRPIVFLFGAGASHGAGYIIPEKPPLGANLHHVLAEEYPGSWGALPREVKLKFESENFEAGMGVMYESYSPIVPELMREMAVYLVQFRPSSNESLYCKLVRSILDRDLLNQTIFTTLNYECALEFSILNQGLMITYFDYGDCAHIPVWKLHGSCNWFSKEVQASSGVTYTKGVTFEGGIEAFLDIGTVVEKCLVNQGLAPAMCLYMRGKPLQISPSVVKQLQEQWHDLVLNCKAVFCIGLNPVPEDNHIWDSLSATSARFYFVGDKEAYLRWTSQNRTAPSEFLAPYFHQAFPRIQERLNLHESE